MRWPQRLSTRLILSFGVLLFVVSALAVGLGLVFVNRAFTTTADDDILSMANEAEDRLAGGKDPQSTVDELSTASHFLELYNLDGTLAARSSNLGSDTLPLVIPRHPVRRDGYHTIRFRKQDVRYVRHAIVRDDKVSGYVVVASAFPDTDESLARVAAILAGASVLALLLGIGGMVLVVQRQVRPLRTLTDQALDAAASGFRSSVPAEGPGSEETRELRQALSHLIEAQRQLVERERSFFADSSHVLRTPLAVLQGDIEMLEEGVYGRERAEVVAQARASIGTMSRMISGLLLLSRDSEPDPGAWEIMSAGALLGGLADAARAAYPGLQIDEQFDASLDFAGDRTQIVTLFTSLLENACQYSSVGGRVEIAAFIEGQNGIVEIRDSGFGLEPGESGRVFERFYRGSRARAQRAEGSGLGLAIVRRIAEFHQWTVELLPRDGGGAIARVTFPPVS